MPTVRAVIDGYDGTQRRKKGAVFEATDGQVAYVEKRKATIKGYRPWFVLVGGAVASVVQKPKPKAKANDIA